MKKRAIIFIPILIFLIIIVVIILFQKNIDHDLLLRYLSVLASWPVAILTFSFIFIILFYDQIAKKISEIWEFGFRNGRPYVQIKDQSAATPIKVEEAEASVEASEPEEAETSVEALRDELVKTQKSLQMFRDYIWFEKAIRFMFRSQYRLISFLFLETDKKMTKEIAKKISYISDYLAVGGSPTWTFDVYLKFLKEWNFISEQQIEGQIIIKLTKFGESFVLFCKAQNYTDGDFNSP